MNTHTDGAEPDVVDPFDRLLDAFEDSVRAYLSHPDLGPAAAQRLKRLLPEPAPAPLAETPDRLAMITALRALRLAEKTLNQGARLQVRGALTQIRAALGLADDAAGPVRGEGTESGPDLDRISETGGAPPVAATAKRDARAA